MIWKVAVLDYFNIQFGYLQGGAEKKHDKLWDSLSLARDLNAAETWHS
jgi:hypothetical protein